MFLEGTMDSIIIIINPRELPGDQTWTSLLFVPYSKHTNP